jgi:hypothetical protein
MTANAFAQLTPREIRATKRAKRTPFVDQSVNQDVTTAIPSHQSQISDSNIKNDNTSLDSEQNKCQRTLKHPLHSISKGPSLLPIDEWPQLQDSQDIPPNMVRVPKHEIKTGMPLDLIILRDNHGRQRILVLKSQRIPPTQTEHETMLHVKGTWVLHELSRSYFWPKMAEEIKQFCTACEVCQSA